MRDCFIKNITIPNELFLMWKDENGNRHHVGILTPDRFAYLDNEQLEQAKQANFKGYPAFSMDKTQYFNHIAVFMRRCPPKNRQDFKEHLKAFCLNPDSEAVQNMSDFAFLGYTGAYLPGNPFHLLNPFTNQDGKFEFVMQLAGFHHCYCKNGRDRYSATDKELIANLDPNNLYDCDAVTLSNNEEIFGYVPKGLTKSFHEWIKNNRIKSIKLFRVNGTSDHAYAYAYVDLLPLK